MKYRLRTYPDIRVAGNDRSHKGNFLKTFKMRLDDSKNNFD